MTWMIVAVEVELLKRVSRTFSVTVLPREEET
jgi:hypothetical protein